MKKWNFIFVVLAGIMFLTFTAVNVSLSLSTELEQSSVQLTLNDLIAIADGGEESAQCVADDPGECAVSCGPNGPCCVGNSPNCRKFQTYSITCNGETHFC